MQYFARKSQFNGPSCYQALCWIPLPKPSMLYLTVMIKEKGKWAKLIKRYNYEHLLADWPRFLTAVVRFSLAGYVDTALWYFR
jgi:hypothetical protein